MNRRCVLQENSLRRVFWIRIYKIRNDDEDENGDGKKFEEVFVGRLLVEKGNKEEGEENCDKCTEHGDDNIWVIVNVILKEKKE